MATTFLEPGGDATFGVDLFTANTGSATAVTDFVHGNHLRSIKYAAGAANNNGKHTVFTDAGGRFSVWMYINAYPTATCSFFDTLTSAFGSAELVFRLTSAGVLQLFNSGVQLGANGSTFPLGSWHRLSFAWVVTNSTTYTVKAWLDGALALNVVNAGTLSITGGVDAIFGNVSGDTTFDSRWSDYYIDNSSSLTDPGNIWVTAKRPFASGSANQFTTQVGAGSSGYGSGHAPQVNERALSLTNGWSISSAAKVTEEYTIEGKAVGDIDITNSTIVDYMGWINGKIATISNTPVDHIIVGGVATTITMTTAAAVYTAIAGTSTYPAGGTDIGMDGQYTTTAGLMTLSEAGIVVAYIPSPVGRVIQNGNNNFGARALQATNRASYF